MDKFFDIIKKLRVPAQQGKISRQAAIDALMMEANVSEDIAAKAADNLFKAAPEGGITTLPQAEVIEASFKPGMDKRGKVVEESPSQASGSRNLLTEEEAPGLFSLRRDIESLADEESWKYSMSLYRQKKSKAMEPVYQKYGAQTQKDKELVDELYDVDFENKLVPNEFKSKPEYKDATAKMFIQESVEDIAGADDIVTSILYSDEATKFLENQGLDNYINYIHTQLKDQGLSFNKPLLKRFLKEKFEPEVFAVGGRVGFKDGPGKLGIIQSLLKKVNEIAPGSTAVGKTTKAMNEAAARKKAEQELFAGFNERNPIRPSNEKIIEREKIDVDIGTIEDFYDDFVQAGGDPSVTLKNLQQGYNLKKAYPFNTPYINKKGKLIGQEATQKMYPESKKFYIEDENVLSQRITDIREGRMPRTAEGERTGVDVPPMPSGFKLSREKLLKNYPEIDEAFADQIMAMDKDMQGITLTMIKDRKRDPELYDQLLEKYGQSDKFQAEFDKAVRRKLNANGGLNYLMGF
jgi:hypothetical protein